MAAWCSSSLCTRSLWVPQGPMAPVWGKISRAYSTNFHWAHCVMYRWCLAAFPSTFANGRFFRVLIPTRKKILLTLVKVQKLSGAATYNSSQSTNEIVNKNYKLQCLSVCLSVFIYLFSLFGLFVHWESEKDDMIYNPVSQQKYSVCFVLLFLFCDTRDCPMAFHIVGKWLGYI